MKKWVWVVVCERHRIVTFKNSPPGEGFPGFWECSGNSFQRAALFWGHFYYRGPTCPRALPSWGTSSSDWLWGGYKGPTIFSPQAWRSPFLSRAPNWGWLAGALLDLLCSLISSSPVSSSSFHKHWSLRKILLAKLHLGISAGEHSLQPQTLRDSVLFFVPVTFSLSSYLFKHIFTLNLTSLYKF